MLCTGRSSPNWLDRLRSSKGFPVSNGIDLENFLNANPNNNDSILEKDDRDSNIILVAMEEKKVATEPGKKTMKNSKGQRNCEKKNKKKEDLFDIMSSILSELFNMGGDSGENFDEIRGKKKSCRKQKNPKLCVISASASVDDCVPTMSPSSADNSVIEEIQKKIVDEDDDLKADTLGYSKADVMIIDTSAPVWKSEKLVFRKGNVWKVREKKSKCRNVLGSRKKRKSSQLSDSEHAGKKNKRNVSLSLPSTSEDAAGGEKCIMVSKEGCPPNEAMEACKETIRNLSQIPEKRLRLSRTPRKPAKKGSSVLHVQDIPSSRKNAVHLPNTSP